MSEESGTRTFFKRLLDAWNNRDKGKSFYQEEPARPSPALLWKPIKVVFKHEKFGGNITSLKKSRVPFDVVKPLPSRWPYVARKNSVDE